MTLWVLTSLLSGRSEAWDSDSYWKFAYPAAILLSGVLGYLAPERSWRWGFVVMVVQALTLAVAAASFGLLPIGLILFGILSVPTMGAAKIGAMVSRKHGDDG